MPTPGGCLCGAVRYTIAAEPLGARMCWCRDCQRIASGSATVNVLFLEEAVAITGDLALFTMIADSGNTVERGFCKVCGAQIYSRTGGFMGLSFAIPIDVATRVQGQLVATGRVERGRFGVSIQELDQSLARAFGMSTPRGALVTGVEPDSPAAAAGLKTGDVIVALDGRPIDRSAG